MRVIRTTAVRVAVLQRSVEINEWDMQQGGHGADL